MEKITKDFLLKDLKVNLIKGLARAEHDAYAEVIILFGKVKYIKDLLLRVYGYDIESDNLYLFNLYKELFYKF